MMPTEKPKAKANPTKAFFVNMITRDITLEDCIFDLIDNSIDGVWKQERSQPMDLNHNIDLTSYKISIEMKQGEFSIRDNCGGISKDDAENYAFTFGRTDTSSKENPSIGVYGIGMKRAVFKIGSKINISSTYKNNGVISSFVVPIDVKRWLETKDGNWEFEIEDSGNLSEPGVQISITHLNEAANQLFESQRFVQDLRRAIARDYALYLRCGLTIEVQKVPVPGWSIELKQSGDFAPMRNKFKVQCKGEDVFVEILAGMEAPPPEDDDPDEDYDIEQNRSGWYVVCNGRVVLAADKTNITGWGTDGWPQWHPQYSGFLGLILFSSRQADHLPLTTTKRSVDVSSLLYRKYRSNMREVSRVWIDYTNARKQSDKVEVSRKEQEAKAIPISEVAEHPTVVLPNIKSTRIIRPANVHYSVPKARIRKLATVFGDASMSYKDIGRKSFEYAYEELVGDE